MTGSCERSACGSARPVADAIWPFAALRPDMTGSRPTRQGVSSTDKDVMPRCDASGVTGEFSSFVRRSGNVPTVGHRPAAPYSAARPSRTVATLVDGRCGRGLDTGAVWVKLPLGEGKRAAHRADSVRAVREDAGDNGSPPRSRRLRGGGQRADRRGKEVLPLPSHRSARMEGADPAAARRRTP